MTRSNIAEAVSVTILLAAGAAAQTQAEREQAVRYLSQTRTALMDAVEGLSDAQWKFKPAADRWSIAEIVEHLAVVEDLVSQKVLVDLPKAQLAGADRNAKQVDAMIQAKMTDRSTKYQAPEPIVPTGRWTPVAALQHFLDSRAETMALTQSTPALREHVIAHPAFGPLDGYEWVLAVSAHTERHTKQLLEVKADPNFPALALSERN